MMARKILVGNRNTFLIYFFNEAFTNVLLFSFLDRLEFEIQLLDDLNHEFGSPFTFYLTKLVFRYFLFFFLGFFLINRDFLILAVSVD